MHSKMDSENNQKDLNLEVALKQCTSISKISYDNAKHYAFAVKFAVNKACVKILACRDEMRKFKITDANIVNKIQNQLTTIQAEFTKSVEQMGRDLDAKYRQLARFNITLFGRTKAGKSTLMEILTHGDGKSIGKGGQRTTLDVRSYDWNGLCVTDVPGIDAYGGAADDALAENAAKYADLILFMITAGQPESTEAEWLVKLKRMDKALICLCNYKSSLADEHRLHRFLAHPEKLAEDMRIDGIKDQFNDFVKKDLPNEHIDIVVAHLQAMYLSMQPEYREKSFELSCVSNFKAVEKLIIQEIIRNGVLYREKSFLSIVDNPLYVQMRQLFDFCMTSMSQYKVINDKLTEFITWKNEFNSQSLKNLNHEIHYVFLRLKNSVAGFVEDNLESSYLSSRWENHIQSMQIEKDVSHILENYYYKAQNYIDSLFKDLGEELSLNYKSSSPFKGGDFGVTNWKRGFGWASAISGIGILIGFALQVTPIGWICTGLGLLFGALSFLSDSREKKLHEKRQALSQKLNESIDKMEQGVLKGSLVKLKDAVAKLQNNAESKFRMMKNSLLTLACSERDIALSYVKSHLSISKAIVTSILNSDSRYKKVVNAVAAVARIPSKFTVIVMNQQLDVDFFELSTFVSSKLGCNEKVLFKKINLNLPKKQLVESLLIKFGIQTWVKFNEGDDSYAYIARKGNPSCIKDDLNIVEQLAGIQLIQRG